MRKLLTGQCVIWRATAAVPKYAPDCAASLWHRVQERSWSARHEQFHDQCDIAQEAYDGL